MCYFCQRNIKEIDWRNERLLLKYISASGKIKGKKKTRICSAHQRKLKKPSKKQERWQFYPINNFL